MLVDKPALTVKLNSQNWHIFWKIIGKAGGLKINLN